MSRFPPAIAETIASGCVCISKVNLPRELSFAASSSRCRSPMVVGPFRDPTRTSVSSNGIAAAYAFSSSVDIFSKSRLSTSFAASVAASVVSASVVAASVAAAVVAASVIASVAAAVVASVAAAVVEAVLLPPQAFSVPAARIAASTIDVKRFFMIYPPILLFQSV